MRTNQMLKAIKMFFNRHSTKILAAAAVGAEVLAVIFAAKEGPIARDRLNELDKDAKWTDKLKAVGPVYLPAFGMLVLSSGCIIGGCAAGEKKIALASSLYTASEAALRDYQKKVVETLGTEKAQMVQDAVAQKTFEDHPVTSATVYQTGKGDQLIYDPLSGRYFTSDVNEIVRAMNTLNKRIYNETWITVNDWYYELGLEGVGLGDGYGWNVDHFIDIPTDPKCWMHTTSPDNRSAFMITYYNRPVIFK